MKKRKSNIILIILLALGLLMSCGVPVRPQVCSDEFTQRVAHMELVTRMHLTTVKLGNPIRGSGILLSQDENSSLLLVAGHSAEHIKRGRGSIVAGLMGPYCAVEVVAISAEHDVGLVRAKCRLQGIPARFASRPVETGEDVYVLGHSLGKPYTLTKGIASNTHRKYGIGVRHNMFLQVDAHGLIGNSGGPVFNTKGEVVGVMSGGPFAPVWTPFGPDRMRNVMVPHMALCVPLKYIRNFLAKQGVL